MQTQAKNPKKITDIFKNISLLAIVVTAITIAFSVSYLEYLDFARSTKKIESDYITSQKRLIKNEILKITNYITLRRSLIEQTTKEQIKSRVYEAHSIAKNIVTKFRGVLPDAQIQKIIIESLRPLRFFNGDGYYFILTQKGIPKLQPLIPEIEGSNGLKFKNLIQKNVIKKLLDTVSKTNEGFVTYAFNSFKSKEIKPKITYLKIFKEYDWIIGVGNYLNNIEHAAQKEILHYIEQIKFGKNSYIFVVNYDGIVLMNPAQKHMIGNSIVTMEDANGVNIFQEQRKAVENPEGGYIHYMWNRPSTSTLSPKVSFMKGVKDWHWMVGTGLYIDDIKTAIGNQKENLRSAIIKQIFFIFIISLLVSLIIIYITNRINKRFTRELGLFLYFFKNLSLKSDKFKIDSLEYSEFRELATTANKMLDTQIEIEDERVKTEALLRSSEANLSEAQKITHFGSWKHNIKNGNLFWSDEVYRIFELDNHIIKPSYELFLDHVHPDDKELVRKTYKNSIDNKTSYDIEHRIKLKDGKIKLVREHGKTYYDENGNAVRSTGTIQDVTEIRSKDEQLKRSQKMDALGKLTGGIAHDYNNILGIILGYSDLLVEHVANNSKIAKYVEHIITASKRGRNLTKKLLTFSRHKNSQKEIIDVNDEIKNQQNMLEKTLTARIELTLDLTDDVWPIEVDIDDLDDSIVNIVINSSHAIECNGLLTIKTRNINLTKSAANKLTLIPGEYVALSFIDSGKGMDAQTQSKIFDPFYTTKGDNGTGLGLSQVYGFVQRSNGNINVISEINQGTEIILHFPRCSSNSEEFKKTATQEYSSMGNETILVVDDEIALCEMANDILSAQGYKVLMANSANHAMEILKQNKVDLLLSDIIMPRMNGYQLAAQVSKKYPDIIIQLVSGYTDLEVLTTNDNNGVSKLDVFQKPYTKGELLNQITKLFKKNKPLNQN